MAHAYVMETDCYYEFTEDGRQVVAPYRVVVEFRAADQERKDPGHLLMSAREFRFRSYAQELADSVNDLLDRGRPVVARDASGVHFFPWVPDLRTLRERFEDYAEEEREERAGLRPERGPD